LQYRSSGGIRGSGKNITQINTSKNELETV